MRKVERVKQQIQTGNPNPNGKPEYREWCRSEDVAALEVENQQLNEHIIKFRSEQTRFQRDLQHALDEIRALKASNDKLHADNQMLLSGFQKRHIAIPYGIVIGVNEIECSVACEHRQDMSGHSVCRHFGELNLDGDVVLRHEKCKAFEFEPSPA